MTSLLYQLNNILNRKTTTIVDSITFSRKSRDDNNDIHKNTLSHIHIMVKPIGTFLV